MPVSRKKEERRMSTIALAATAHVRLPAGAYGSKDQKNPKLACAVNQNLVDMTREQRVLSGRVKISYFWHDFSFTTIHGELRNVLDRSYGHDFTGREITGLSK